MPDYWYIRCILRYHNSRLDTTFSNVCLEKKMAPKKGEVIAPMSPSGANLAGPNVLGKGMSGLVGPDVPGKGTSGHYCQHSVDCAGMLARLQIA